MISRLHLGVIIVLALGTIAAGVWLSGGKVSSSWFTFIGAAVFVVGLAIAAFNLWLWRLGWLQGWFVKRPHLWGEWDVHFDTEWTDPNTGERREPVKGSLGIRQTYSSVQVRMTSPQSSGDLLGVNVISKEDGGFRLVGVYRNEPRLSERARSTIHYGAFLLDIKGPPNHPDEMVGHYWTDRDTKGEMTITNRRSR